MGVKISALSAGSAPSSGDKFVIVQSASTVKIDYDDIETSILAAQAAQVIDSGDYTALPPTTSTITFSDTTGLYAGMALKITQNATDKYYLITSVTSNTSIAVAGPFLDTGNNITAIATLDPSRVQQMDIFCPGLYCVGGATTGLISRETRSALRWQASRAYLVYAAMRHNTADGDSGNQPTVNVSIGGTNVLLDNSNNGIELPNGTSWVASGPPTASAGPSSSNYLIEFGDAIELDLTTAPGDLDARDLTASLAFILE